MAEVSARVEFGRRMAAGDAGLRLYAILDGESCERRGLDLLDVARAWREAGIALVQYRDKRVDPETMLARALRLREVFEPGWGFLLMNDHPGLAVRCGFDGAHVGQGDGGVEAARAVLGADGLLGVSTNTPDQALAAGVMDVDYVAVGPVYATATKADAEPEIGLCAVQAARAVVRRPLVAIGGIGPGQGRAVLRAGADTVALISALLPDEQGVQAVTGRARDILAGLK